MDQILASAQKIIRNKNFVTIAGVIIILILLYIGYSSQINKAVQPVQVPVATATIQPRTEITEDMVQTIDMPSISVTENVIRSSSEIIGKYSNINSVIPSGSMFYRDTVIEKSELPDSVFVKVKNGEIIYSFPVDIESTFGNSIVPGSTIDIYMKTGDGTDEKIMMGKLIENIEVLAVKDSTGRDVFENTSEERTPAYLFFGLPSDINMLLRKAAYLNTIGVELFPIPHGGELSTEESSGATEVSTEQLKQYIEAHAIDIPTDNANTDTLKPTVSISGKKAKIKFPSGCKKKYTCSYSVIYDEAKLSSSKGTVKKTSKSVTIKGNGTLTATVIDSDGNEHVLEQVVVLDSATGKISTKDATTTTTDTTTNNTNTTGTTTDTTNNTTTAGQ